MAAWQVTGYKSDKKLWSKTVSGRLSDAQMLALLQRLVCMHLSEDEIISSSLQSNDPKRTAHLDRVGGGAPLCVGSNPYYTAVKK
jgi:hypothetical protein